MNYFLGPSTLLSTIFRASAKASAGVENGIVAASLIPSSSYTESAERYDTSGVKIVLPSGQFVLVQMEGILVRVTDPWEVGFAALTRFYAREGHCRPSRFHREGNFSLGPWVSNQRYYKDKLTPEHRRRLNRLGFVWNWRDYLWDLGFATLLEFKRREGHCRVPASHVEGNYMLGYWVSSQRRNRNKMSAERKTRLNNIGFIWDTKGK